MSQLEFWFEFGSTYSYPAALRIEQLAGSAGVEVVWRPFLLGPIFKSKGWSDSPFNLYPAKGRSAAENSDGRSGNLIRDSRFLRGSY